MRTEHLHATRARIYPPDIIPLWYLTAKRALNHIGKTFRFEQFQPLQPEEKNLLPGIALARGHAPAAEADSPATIESLQITPTQIELTTRDADGHGFNDVILLQLNKVCDEITERNKGWLNQHRFEVVQTVWVGQLDLNAEDLIDPRAKSLILPAISKVEPPEATPKVYSQGVKFRIVTPVSHPALLELGLQPADQEFKLEPRAGRLASEQMWFSSSALRSEDHLHLLEELERIYRA